MTVADATAVPHRWHGGAEIMKRIAHGLAALRRPRDFKDSAALYWDLFARGGFVVRTPATGRAMIATTVQPDGDILAVIDAQVLEWDDARQEELRSLHASRVRQSLAKLAVSPDLLRGVMALGWLPFVGLQAYTLAAVPLDAALQGGGGVLSALLHAALRQLWPQLTAVVFAVLRWLSPWVVRTGLRWQRRRESAAWLRQRQAKA